MKYLIIPDVHNRISLVEKIIKAVKPDLTIFLGDYFDDFYDNPDIIIDVAKWFKKSVQKKDRIHLCGNHDVHYWFKDNIRTRCSGYDHFKSIAINDIVTNQEWEKLKFFYVLDGKWLLSHAGVHPVWINPDSFKSNSISSAKLSDVVEKLDYDSTQAMKNLYANGEHWFTYAGFSRSSRSRSYGGLLWCDWNQEFFPIKGIHQIVGHTPQRSIKWVVVAQGADQYGVLPMGDVSINTTLGDKFLFTPTLTETTSYNLCLDTHPGSQNYAIYENGALTIHKSCDLK